MPLPPRVIDEIRSRETGDGNVKLFDSERFRSGDAVRVTDGPLLDHTGMFECMDGRERVIILLDILGRESKVGLPQEYVAACA